MSSTKSFVKCFLQVASVESKEGCPITPGSTLSKSFILNPNAQTNKNMCGIALDGKIKVCIGMRSYEKYLQKLRLFFLHIVKFFLNNSISRILKFYFNSVQKFSNMVE